MTTGANNFKPFAVGGSANTISQATYEALATLIANGFVDGVADSAKVNKVLRQASIGSAVLGEIIAANGDDALDDGNVESFKTKLIAALGVLFSVNIPDASTTVKGIVELATGPETVAGSDANRAVTPSGLFSVLGLGVESANGYAAFPFKDASSGVLRSLIIQWGVGASGSTGSATFPIAFPSACVGATIIDAIATNFAVTGKTTTTLSWSGAGGTTPNWIAIGY